MQRELPQEKKHKMSLEKQEEYLNHKHMILEEEEHRTRQKEQAGKEQLEKEEEGNTRSTR